MTTCYYALVTTLTNASHEAFKLSFLDAATKLKLQVCAGLKREKTEESLWVTTPFADFEQIGFIQVCKFVSEVSASDEVITKLKDNIIEALESRNLDYLSIIVLRQPDGMWFTQSGKFRKLPAESQSGSPYRSKP